MAIVVLVGSGLFWGGTCPVAGQTLEGRVLDERDGRPVPAALIRLLDESGEQQRVVIADSSGAFTVGVPGPGAYRLEAARLGFGNVETPLVEAALLEGVYPVEMRMSVAPVRLPGFTVAGNQLPAEELSRSIRVLLGTSSAYMRYRPLGFLDLREHVDQRNSLEDVMRMANFSDFVVRPAINGLCFSLRSGGCLPVFLNGMILNRDFLPGVPVDMLYSIVVITPGDRVAQYPLGAVLLYTEAWLR